jgi:hypothetical protein
MWNPKIKDRIVSILHIQHNFLWTFRFLLSFISAMYNLINVARMGEKRNEYRLLVGKPEGKRPLGGQRRRWVDNVRMDLGEVGWVDVDWIGLTKDRNRWRAVVNSVLNLRVP